LSIGVEYCPPIAVRPLRCTVSRYDFDGVLGVLILDRRLLGRAAEKGREILDRREVSSLRASREAAHHQRSKDNVMADRLTAL